jgi:putative membrane protein
MLVGPLRVSQVLRLLVVHIFGYSAWSAFVVVIHTLGHAPARLGVGADNVVARIADGLWWSDVGVPFAATGALGSALAIFLGFRNNSAYDRWWEARKIWGELVNDSRTWARLTIAIVREGDTQRMLLHRHLATIYALAYALRGRRDAAIDAVARLAGAAVKDDVKDAPNIVSALLLAQSRTLAELKRSGGIDAFEHQQLEGTIENLTNAQGKCERIKNTPLPRQYDTLPQWFVLWYGVLVPWSLAEPVGWAAVPLSVAITLAFVMLEGSGRAIEEPFEGAVMDTPMLALATTIERDVRFALGEPLPQAATPDVHGVLW